MVQPNQKLSEERISPKKFDWEFNTFNDATLIKLLDQFKAFISLKRNTFFTVSGPTEIGKTHLLKKCKEYYEINIPDYTNKEFGAPIIIYTPWEKIVTNCFKNDEYLNKLEGCGVLLIEDFLSENSNNNFTNAAYEIAYKLINRRVGKLTIIDTNKSEDDIKLIDVRIHSRLFREDGKFISVKKSTTPYLERLKHVS